MPRLLFGHDKTVAEFVAERLPNERPAFGPLAAIGVIDAQGCLIAGAVYHGFQERYGTLEFSGAAISPLAFSPGIVRAVLSFPFETLAGINKVWAQTSLKNLRSQRLLKGVGFVQEAILNSEYGADHHACRFRLLRSDWEHRWGVQRFKRTHPRRTNGLLHRQEGAARLLALDGC